MRRKISTTAVCLALFCSTPMAAGTGGPGASTPAGLSQDEWSGVLEQIRSSGRKALVQDSTDVE